MRNNNFNYVSISLFAACLALAGFLLGIHARGFCGATVYFQLPVLVFCTGMFFINLIDYLKND